MSSLDEAGETCVLGLRGMQACKSLKIVPALD